MARPLRPYRPAPFYVRSRRPVRIASASRRATRRRWGRRRGQRLWVALWREPWDTVQNTCAALIIVFTAVMWGYFVGHALGFVLRAVAHI